jgi:DNA mismatch repair protein MutS2
MTINLITAKRSLHHTQVEWDALAQIIAQFAYFESNKTSLTSEVYFHRTDDLLAEFVRVQDYSRVFKSEYHPILSQLLTRLPIDNTLDRLLAHVAKQGVLNFSELNKLALMIECGQFFKNDFPLLQLKEFQHLKGLEHQGINRKFLREFRHLVDENGEVHFERHTELAELTKRQRELEERIRRTVQDWINEPKNQKSLQYNSYDVHYDRFVVPVRSDSYRSDIGLIVSRSESGQTLFVEPYEIRESCNRRLELISKIDEIINQLAMKFSHLLSEFSEFLKDILNQIIVIDHYVAKINFNQNYQLECPSIKATAGFRFSGLFHPLLTNAVKNSANCSSSDHGIVISGPNTGGKTVFLKSIALSYLLFYHGFFVPASEAEMFPYEGLFYFGNDLQDLNAGLSSFSGEVKNYIQLIEDILPSNLILIDEIFNSTSSDEASALSLAYFDELHRRALCHLVVSTHHQMFKTLIHQDRNYLSCHVGFDTKNMQPTYKIQWGTPGSSMAIEIFKILARHHAPVADVPQRALSHLSAKNVSYETLLQKVSQKQIDLDQLLARNRQHEMELKNQKGAMEGILKLKLKEELSSARKEIDKIMNEARKLVEEARKNEITKHRKVDEKSHQLKAQIDKLGGIIKSTEEPLAMGNLRVENIKVGDIVYSNVLKKDFVVYGVDIRKSEATIAKGQIKLTVPVFTLSSGQVKNRSAEVSVSFQKNTHAKLEIDTRGLRLSEFQNTVDRVLGDLLSGDVPFLNIIHGHGDGVLKNWLRDYLKHSKDFQAEASESGNDGETKIILR